ncbi:alternative ribosome rescue aminoacyl-tRNA hydrolase ArfB [Yeosuana sp. MJ-SS3]|uniref:Alternative ribosome rescue aminoacyl-tRNA hydrolase ArfB n=1 Tax=Gilvirhabdus luticola TaxID=3079858 RepID=A0ABU3U3D3_9FLAO|nr:alternative ribosome rescue aminoacyl-tRNA hydrolase ArfB [Yeosuana sp. MJ-SS3]MDU8884915.1 alternative ribosome rescue aminoacyl-tRNA hydrolase ArfB [Yeosuana sp. MJ-SS3]
MLDENALISELSFKAIRSSGAGGQHVNKVSSKVELSFNLNDALFLDDEQKKLLHKNLKNKLSKEGLLVLQCDESRSQHKNKTIVINRFLDVIKEGLIVPKKRKKTKVPKSVKKKRLEDKKKISEKKINRKSPKVD